MSLGDLNSFVPVLSGAIGALATLAAVAVTGIITLKVAKMNLGEQRRQRYEETKLQKLEELFSLFDKWQLTVSTICLAHYRCYLGKLSYSQVDSVVDVKKSLAPGDAQKYLMILDVHFPSLREAYAPVEEARKKIAPFLGDPKDTRLAPDAFVAAQLAFEEAARGFKGRLSSFANELQSK